MTIITGTYERVKKEYEAKTGEPYFEFYFPFVKESERHFSEIDRFLWESRKLTRFKNRYEGEVLVDVSEWNEPGKGNNRFFNAFMYFLKDFSIQHNRVTLMADQPCCDALLLRLQRFFTIEEICLEPHKAQQPTKIGFIMLGDKEKETVHVRS